MAVIKDRNYSVLHFNQRDVKKQFNRGKPFNNFAEFLEFLVFVVKFLSSFPIIEFPINDLLFYWNPFFCGIHYYPIFRMNYNFIDSQSTARIFGDRTDHNWNRLIRGNAVIDLKYVLNLILNEEKAHFCTQWAAVRTHHSLMIAPPQNWDFLSFLPSIILL